MPTIKLFSPLFYLLSVLFVSTAHALPSDRQATIVIESDRAQLNEKTGITEYQGTVVIQQGSLLIEADQVTIYSTDGQANKIISIGKPAHYQQQPNSEDGLVNARASTIEYYIDTETITLIKNASLELEGSTLEGEHINYDLKAELVEARGSNNSSQRVYMVIPASKPSTEGQITTGQTTDKQIVDETVTNEQKDND